MVIPQTSISHSSQQVGHFSHTDFGVRGLSIQLGQTEWATTKLVNVWVYRAMTFYNYDIWSKTYIPVGIDSPYKFLFNGIYPS